MPGVSAAALAPVSLRYSCMSDSVWLFYLQMALRAESAGQSLSLLQASGSFQDGRLLDGGLWQGAVQTVRST